MDFKSIPRPLIIAHRGYKARYPENTRAAFMAALAAGAKMIELDVALTLDRKIIVIHDETVDRTSNGQGYVRDSTLDQLRRLDAGTWFGPEFSGEQMPTLDEVLTLCRDKALLNVEIKPEAIDSTLIHDSIELQVLSKLNVHGMTDQVMVSSFEKKVIDRISSINGPNPLLALLSEDPLNYRDVDFMGHHGVYAYNPDHRVLTQDQVMAAQEKGLKVFTYTVNTKEDAKRCFDMGVDGIFTDDPVLMEEVVRGM